MTQTPGTRIDQWRQTLELIDELLLQARNQKADVVLLPECVWPAYFLGKKADFFAARAAGLPSHEHFLDHLRARAREHRLAICAGYVEEKGDRLFNAACFFDAGGELLGIHRKCFLWDFDHDWFEPGEKLQPFDTPFGRVGLMICADARMPEIPATLAARGAQWLLQPTAWVNAGTPERPWNPQPDFLIPARAIELGIPIASASKIGPEGAASFVGGSLICDGDGQVAARCEGEGAQIVVAEVEPRAPGRIAVTDAQREILRQRYRRRKSAFRNDAIPSVGEGVAKSPVGVSVMVPATGPPIVCAMLEAECVGFAVVRCLSLQGALLIRVFGDRVRRELLQTRAAENRVFIQSVWKDHVVYYGPDGRELDEAWHIESLHPDGLDEMWPAENKCVAPRTDVIADRRPETYEF